MMADVRLSGYRLAQAPTRTVGTKALHAALLSLLLIGQAAPGDRATVVGYVTITLVLAAFLSRVRARPAAPAPLPERA